jgi:50S ribosomal protein L16 3-hydroxylase
MFLNQANLSPELFLRDYWQQKPLLLRQAFPDFEPELDVDDIAGLACDELAESRLVSGRFPSPDWTLRYGPFSEEDFAALPERDWTLLVQDVEKHYPPLQTVLTAFSFLPRWRIDDLMVSVAAPGGSVGPHIDQYDVFLLQAAGRRRWEIATACEPDLLPDCELNVLQRFAAEQSWDLEPGDLLYLPPGVAHHGIALDAEGVAASARSSPPLCMTWSIGMRAPSAADLLQALGEWLAASPAEGGRYRDPGLAVAARCGEIEADAVSGLQRLARSAIDDPELFATFLGSFLSSYRMAHEPAPPPGPVDPAGLRKLLRRGARLQHNPWTRLAWLASPDGARLFAAGCAFRSDVGLAALVCDAQALRDAPAAELESHADLLCELVNRGHLLVETL